MMSKARYVLIADYAGSGKTLAFLLPTIIRFKQKEQEWGRITVPKSPSVIIVAPTNELVRQIGQVLRKISPVIKFKTAIFTGGQDQNFRPQVDMLKEGIDFLVCTPGRLLNLLEKKIMNLDRCQALILDEIDILLGEASDFLDKMGPIKEIAGPHTRFVFSTATVPQHFNVQIQNYFDGLVGAIGPDLHHNAGGLKEQLIDCSGGDDHNEQTANVRKVEALELLIQQPYQRVLVFCNKIETCRFVENYLKRKDKKEQQYKVYVYHAALKQQTAYESIQKFREEPSNENDKRLLISTDRVSRGIDFVGCDHVILFDFPRDPSEYVRRAGRTARGGLQVGHLTSLVIGRQSKIAKEIMSRNASGKPIHSLPKFDTQLREFTVKLQELTAPQENIIPSDTSKTQEKKPSGQLNQKNQNQKQKLKQNQIQNGIQKEVKVPVQQ